MKQYNLHSMIEALRSALLSYMCSSLPVGNHESQRFLGEEFYRRWEEDAFRGPYLEAVPKYAGRASLEQIFSKPTNSGASQTRFRELFRPRYSPEDFRKFLGRKGASQDSLELAGADELRRTWERPLYDHQLRALSMVTSSKNLVVSTGTGSGKTDCFLLPLLYSILSEPPEKRKEPGVRALLLYPMNALVEDQMRRLRTLLCWVNGQSTLAPPGAHRLARFVTFGRYVGMTRVNASDKYEERANPSPNIAGLGEMLYREEMQATPPDILITNFSMLEYMLLRNDDRRIFARPELFRLLVLDEIHTYRGTQGMEVACLLRRMDDLLQRKAHGSAVNYQRVGLSATLPSDEGSRKSLADFASELFGCDLGEECVITEPERKPADGETGGPWPSAAQDLIDIPSLAPSLCTLLGFTVGSGAGPDEIAAEEWQLLAEALQSSVDDSERDLEMIEKLGRVLAKSPVFRALRTAIETARIARSSDVASLLFGDAIEPKQRENALGILLQLVCAGRVAEQGLLPTRVHFFVKEQREALLCTNPGHPQGGRPTDSWWRKLYLPHRARCDDCGALVFPLCLCRRCGFVFMEAWFREGHYYPEPDGLMPSGSFARVLFRPLGSIPEPLMLRFRSDPPEGSEVEERTMCLNCGTRFAHGPGGEYAVAAHPCGQQGLLRVLEWSSPGAGVRITTCPHCEQTYYGEEEVVTPPVLSPYGATTVLLEEMKRILDAPLKDQITKVLCFSDSRQQAAKIARRLGRTNLDTVFRQLVYRALLRAPSRQLKTRQIVDHVTETLMGDVGLAEAFSEEGESAHDEARLRKRVATLLFREFCMEFQTLEGLGLVRVEYPEAVSEAGARAVATHWLGERLSAPEQHGLFRAFVDWHFRLNRWAVTAATLKVDYSELLHYRYRDKTATKYSTATGSLGFLMKNNASTSRRFNLYRRLCRAWPRILDSVADKDGFNKLAGGIWEQSVAKADFVTSQRDRGGADPGKPFIAIAGASADEFELKLNIEAARWILPDPGAPVYRCSSCGYVSSFDIHGVCPVRNCSGKLESVAPEDVNAERFSPSGHYARLLTGRTPKPLWVEEHTAQLSPRRRAEIEAKFRDDSAGGLDVISGSTTFELGVDLGEVNSVVLANLPPEISNYRQRAGRAGRRPGMLPFILGYVRERPHDRYFWSRIEDFIAGPLRVPWFAKPSKEIVLRHANAVITASALSSYGPSPQLQGPPCGQFVDFCLSSDQRPAIESSSRGGELSRSLQALLSVNPELSLGPRDCADQFLHLLERHRKRNFASRMRDPSIDVLSDYGVLPSYSFPIYVDELVLYDIPASEAPRANLKLTRDRRIALREYFPGRLIEADKWVLESVGVGEGFDRKSMSVCQTCRKVFGSAQTSTCRACGGTCAPLRAVIPWGGFLGRVTPSPPSSDQDPFGLQVSEVIFDPASEPEPELRPVGRFLLAATQSAAQMTNARMRMFSPRPANEGLMLVESREMDVGGQGRSPMLCLMLPERAANAVSQGATPHHLMHEFTTDILRLRFDASFSNSLLSSPAFERLWTSGSREEAEKARTIFLYTMGQAIATAAGRCLQISPTELDFTLRRAPDSAALSSEIILFDTAPGGAGYASRCGEPDELRQILKEALVVLSCPTCADSCYNCLRTYSNQWLHGRLNKAFVEPGLRKLIATDG